jgi:hypothetical protein
MKSKFLRLDLKDVLRGAALAVVTSIMMGIMPILQTGQVPDIATIKVILLAGVSTGIAYLGKNLFTSSDDEFLKSEDKT